MIKKPVQLYFEPLQLEAKFEKCLKLQVAIFRLNKNDPSNKRAVKIDKTEPMKFTNPNEKITFKKTLCLMTTLPYNTETKTYQSKEVDFQLALEIDGTKQRIARKINLKDVIMTKGKPNKIVHDNPSIVLHYRAQLKIQQPPVNNQLNEQIVAKKARFDEPQMKENINEPKKQPLPLRSEKSKTKTVYFQSTFKQDLKIEDTHSEQSKMRLIKKISNVSEIGDKNKKIKIVGNYSIEEQKQENLSTKNKELNILCKELQKQKLEKEQKLEVAMAKIDGLQTKLQSEAKIFKKEKQEFIKKEKALRSQYESQIAPLKEEIGQYKLEIERLSKSALNMHESSKNIAINSQLEIRTLKDRIKKLQKSSGENNKENEELEQLAKDKNQIIADLKNKVCELDKENLELQFKVKSAEAKLAKNKSEYETEIAELVDQIAQMKQQNRTLKIPTLKDIKDDATDYRKKAETLEKERDQQIELLKKMTEKRKQLQNERQNDINSLKKQISSLKETIFKLQNSKQSSHNDNSTIECKIQMEKMKKDLELIRKNQKGLLIEKGKVEATNRTLQDDLVRNKNNMANIMNAIQQTGNEKLISDVYGLIQ